MAAAQGRSSSPARDGRDPYADDVPHPDHSEEIAEGAIGAPRRAPRSFTCTRASLPTQADAEPGDVHALPPQIKAASNVVINLTTGGAPTMTIEDRLQPALKLKAEVASLNMGSMNFGCRDARRYKDWKYDWRNPTSPLGRAHLQEHLQGYRLHPAIVQRQRHALRDRVLRHRPSVHAAHFLDRKLVKPPLFISRCSASARHRPHPEDVMHMKRTATACSATSISGRCSRGRNQMFVAAQSAVMGGNVRVGLEDSLCWTWHAREDQRGASHQDSRIWKSSGCRSRRRTKRARC